MASCSRPSTIHPERLRLPRTKLAAIGSRKHTCHIMSNVCLWRREYILQPEDEPKLRSVLRTTKVRGVHVGFMETSLGETKLFRYRNRSDPAVMRSPSFSSCVPLVWWPLWGYNLAEFFLNSVTAVSELLDAGVIDDTVSLAPEVGGWRLVGFQEQMLRALSRQPVRTPSQIAPRCKDGQRCQPQCFARMLVCRFKDVYDKMPPIAPARAAQRILPSFNFPQEPQAAAADPFVVLFVDRQNAKQGARRITNVAGLLERCRKWRASSACVGDRPTRCELHTFGRRGLRADVKAVRRAHVLVGTHGAALTHAMFMRPRSAFVEIRPYHFDGSWPDSYHYAMAQRENATRAFVVRTVDPSLCTPIPQANVSAWDARPLDTHVLPRVLLRALDAAACTRGLGDELLGSSHVSSHAGLSSAITTLAQLPRHPRSRFDYNALMSPVLENG